MLSSMKKGATCIAAMFLLATSLPTARSFTFVRDSKSGSPNMMRSQSRVPAPIQGNQRTTLTASTTVEPPPTDTREKTGRRGAYDESYDKANEDDFEGDEYDDLEYLYDVTSAREMDDPFHILLLGSTFDKPKVTIPYVSGSLEYVLSMPRSEATEQTIFAKEEGLSCLGTWSREECLSLGRKLQTRDIVCRVVPYAEGGQRGWQAKKEGSSSSSYSSQ